ncbi:MAG: 16S rRNA (cytidine(1402)-2'-O)-methyltransferase [Patescibacteria group bacterium]
MNKLYIVATPIGNLEDITFRAIRILKEVDLIACEDTRQTVKLLNKYEIKNKLVSYHQHSKVQKIDYLITQLTAGNSIALVSDAGTPGISDPGSKLISEAINNNIEVIPIPGPSALITALSGAGVDTSKFVYYGFMPHKKGRETLFKQIKKEEQTVVFYESCHRIIKTLESLKDCGKQIVIARELTKIYEEFLRGTALELIKILEKDKNKLKGEMVVII